MSPRSGLELCLLCIEKMTAEPSFFIAITLRRAISYGPPSETGLPIMARTLCSTQRAKAWTL